MSKHKLVFRITALVTLQIFIFSTSASAYPTLTNLSKVKKELRVPAFRGDPSEIVEKLNKGSKRQNPIAKFVKDETILDWSIREKSLEEILSKIVKEYDVRGFDGYGEKEKYPQQFDDKLLVWMGRALGTAEFTSIRHGQTVSLKPGDTFLVAGDNGPSTEWVKENIIKGLRETGINIIDLGVCCSGELYSNVSRFGTQGGLYVTRSHVEIGTNGFKPVIGGITLYGDMLQALKKQILSTEYRKADKSGRIDKSPSIRGKSREMYVASLLEEFDSLKETLDKFPMKIAVNFGGGSAVSYRNVFEELLGEYLVKMFRVESDPLCEKGGLPDPSRSDDTALSNEKCDIMKYSKENPDVIVINFDLDADRISIVWGGNLHLGDEEFYPVIEYQLSVDDYKELNKTFYYDSRMKTEIRGLIEYFGGVAKIHPKGHSKVKASIDLLLRELAEKENLSLEEFLSQHPGFINAQAEYSLHMFLTNDRGEPFDDAVRFSLFWLKVFSAIKEKYKQPNWTLAEYIQDLKNQGIIEESVQLKEQRTPMIEEAKKEVMWQMERNVRDFFAHKAGFELIENWQEFEGRRVPFTLVEVEGVFHLMSPLGDVFWGWSNTSPKAAFGSQSTNVQDLKKLSEIIVALWVHSRNQVAEKLGVKLPVIDDAETAPLRELFGYADLKVGAAEQIEADCIKKYPSLAATMKTLAATAEKPERYALNKHNLSEVEKEAEETMERISKEGMLEALILMSGKEKADLEGLKTERPELKTAIDKFVKIGFDGDNARLGWFGTIRWVLENTEGLTELTDLVEEKRKAGARNFIFCGMGGSVLCVDTVRGTFKEMKGFPPIQTLSDTDPDGVKAVIDFARVNDANLQNTYVIVTSKSGTTAETLSHLEVWERVLAEAKIKLEDRVIILTDSGSPSYETSFWQKRAENLKEAYAKAGIMPYANSPKILTIQLDGKTDIGGRFTAPATRLFLLAAGLRGKNLEGLVQRAAELSGISEPKDNPFIELGVIFYSLAQKGIDQITLILPEELKEIAPWAEQLFEESLGKDGKGLHIIYGEEADLTAYRDLQDNNRVFLRFKFAGKKDENETFVKQLKDKGFPLIEQEIKDDLDITKIMYGLEETVAVIAYLWDINFVDQPAVVLYKNKTKEYAKKDRSEIVNDLKARKDKKTFQDTGITIYYGHLLEQGIVKRDALESELNRLGRNLENTSAEEVTAAIMRIIMDKEDIKCIDTRYYGYDKEIRPVLEDWRNIVKKIFQRATKVSKGPDINHSGEQNAVAGLKGLRLINVAVPEKPRQLSFGKFNYDDKLLIASALGTVDSQAEAGRPALLITLPDTGKTEITSLGKFYKEVAKKIVLSSFTKAFPDIEKIIPRLDTGEKFDKKIASIVVETLNGTEITGSENGKKYYLNASLPYPASPDWWEVKVYYPEVTDGKKVGIEVGKIVGTAADEPEEGVGIFISNIAIDKEHRQHGLFKGLIEGIAKIVSQGSILEGKIREIETLKDLYFHIIYEKGFSLPEMFKQAPEKINKLIGQIEELNDKIEPSRALGSKEPAEELVEKRKEAGESLKNWLVLIIGYYLIDNQIEFDTLKETILGKIWINAGFRQKLHIYSVPGDFPAVFIKGEKAGISDFKSFWAEVFPYINVQLNKENLTEPMAFIIDPALIGDNPSTLLAVLNLKEQLGDKIKIVFQHSPKSEKLGRNALYETIKEATDGAVDLKGKVDWDAPATATPEEIIEGIQKKFEDVGSIRIIGRQDWAKGFQNIERPGLEKITLVVCEIGEEGEAAQGDLAVLLGLKNTGVLPEKEMAELNRRWGKGGNFFIVETKEIAEKMEYIKKYRESLEKFE